MNLRTKLLTLLAIFCVIASAGVVCATDVIDEGGWAGSNYEDANGVSGSQYYQNEAAVGNNQKVLEPGAGSSLENQTGNVHLNAAGSPVNTTNTTNTTNATNPTVVNATNATAPVVANTTNNATSNHSMLATGNPILLVLGVSAFLAGYAVLRRND